MNLLLIILAGLFIVFGLGLFFSPARGAGLAGFICIGSGIFAYDAKSLIPLAVGFGLLWVLRLFGVEER